MLTHPMDTIKVWDVTSNPLLYIFWGFSNLLKANFKFSPSYDAWQTWQQVYKTSELIKKLSLLQFYMFSSISCILLWYHWDAIMACRVLHFVFTIFIITEHADDDDVLVIQNFVIYEYLGMVNFYELYF